MPTSEIEKAAIERHLLNIIRRMDHGKGVGEAELEDILVWIPLSSLLDKGLIYQPVLGYVKVI